MMFRAVWRFLAVVIACACLGGCYFLGNGDNIVTTSDIDPAGHLSRDDYLALRTRQAAAEAAQTATPPPIPVLPPPDFIPPEPVPAGSDRLVSISVTDAVPLRDVLIELAREAKVNLELDPRIQGGVIFSAHNQPFDVVLKRICKLANLRSVTEDSFIRIELDDPYQQSYQLDYLSLNRKATSETAISTNVFDVDIGNGNGVNGGTSSSGGGFSSVSENNSTARITGASEADFWTEVSRSLTQILISAAPKGEKPTGSLSIDKQSGMITVFGDSRQQAAVGTYITKLKRKAYAQVLIDARIIEVELSDQFQSGINWRTLFNGAFNAAASFGPQAVAAPFLTAATATPGVFTGSVNTRDFAGIIDLVRTFGTTRVLSSPRLTVLNNQTAVLKVATNQVYFVTQAQFTTVTNANGAAVTTTPVYTSTPHTVPVGLLMTVQPAIDADHDRITMTLRPTISRVVGEANDPSIGLNAAQAGVANPVQSQIPILAVREMDSVIQLHSGEVAIMGGLMQDSSINTDTGLPPVDALPIVGNLVKSRTNAGTTTELVILLRATVADAPPPDPADGDLYRKYSNDPRPLPVPVTPPPPPPPLPPSAAEGAE